MTLEEAKELRDKHLFLIGQKSNKFNLDIVDVIVCPYDNFSQFISQYRNQFGSTANDELIKIYQSKGYAVKVVYDDNKGIIDVFTDDIYEYKDRISDTTK